MTVMYEDVLSNLNLEPGELRFHATRNSVESQQTMIAVTTPDRRIAHCYMDQFPSCCGSGIISYLTVNWNYRRRGLGILLSKVALRYADSCGWREVYGVSKTGYGQQEFWKKTDFAITNHWINRNSGNKLISLKSTAGRTFAPDLCRNSDNKKFVDPTEGKLSRGQLSGFN